MASRLRAVVSASAALLLVSCSTPRAKVPTQPTDPNVIPCLRTTSPVTVDGDPTDPAWRNAARVENFRAGWAPRNRQPKARTSARLLWDDDYLYFLAEMEDDDIVIASRRHDDRLWLGDVFELFFKPSEESQNYYELQVNPANARLDMLIEHRSADAYDRWRSSRPFEWQTAVRRTENGWTAEGRIPWSDFASAVRPDTGETWRCALSRYDYSTGKPPELSSTASLTRPSFHRWEEWGSLRFQ